MFAQMIPFLRFYNRALCTRTNSQSSAFISTITLKGGTESMCRNIKMLFNFDPPVTDNEIRAASIQFVRKISGFNKPSKANESAFNMAIDEIAGVSARLLAALETNAPARTREEEAARARARNAARFPERTRQ
jgi:hypothetical protein